LTILIFLVEVNVSFLVATLCDFIYIYPKLRENKKLSKEKTWVKASWLLGRDLRITGYRMVLNSCTDCLQQVDKEWGLEMSKVEFFFSSFYYSSHIHYM
jgi:hypothetical protein